jgi:hypothetical protein
VLAMQRSGVAWVRKFYGLNGQPRAQGHHAGQMIGGACGEVLVAAIEEVATAGLGHALFGTRAAGRIEDVADRLRPARRRPGDLDDVLDDAIRAPDAPAPGTPAAQLQALIQAVPERFPGVPEQLRALLATDGQRSCARRRRSCT